MSKKDKKDNKKLYLGGAIVLLIMACAAYYYGVFDSEDKGSNKGSNSGSNKTSPNGTTPNGTTPPYTPSAGSPYLPLPPTSNGTTPNGTTPPYVPSAGSPYLPLPPTSNGPTQPPSISPTPPSISPTPPSISTPSPYGIDGYDMDGRNKYGLDRLGNDVNKVYMGGYKRKFTLDVDIKGTSYIKVIVYGLKDGTLTKKGEIQAPMFKTRAPAKTFDLEDDELIVLNTANCIASSCPSEWYNVKIIRMDLEYYNKATNELIKTRDLRPYLIQIPRSGDDYLTNKYKDDPTRAKLVREGNLAWAGRYRTTENFI